MSLTEPSLETALPYSTRIAGVSATFLPYRVSMYAACTVLALASNYLLGKDMPWDLLNYHLYAGFNAVNDRFSQDYFAAGAVGYFNPYAYVPFYALVCAGLPALAIGSVLAGVHSVILWLTFELAVLVSPSDDPRMRMTYGLCAVALAFMNPILIQQIGSSFADITTAELVLGGWVLLLSAVRTPSLVRVAGAGLLLGVATGLKLTNAVHAVAAIAVLIMLPLPPRRRMRFGATYLTILGLGFVILAAPWSYRLEKTFGNPFFPLMNTVFRSPEFTTELLHHYRFIPGTLIEALWRPFAMVDPVRMVHEELRAPDLRYAVLAVLLCVLLASWLRRRFANPPGAAPRPELPSSERALAAFLCGLGADWVLWLSGSGNGRYFLPMACVAAVMIVALLFRLLALRPKVRNYVLAALFGVQAIQLWMGTDFRWNPVPWGGQWFKVAVPEKLTTEPNLFLTIGVSSNSFIAPFLAGGSGLINFSGGYALGPEGASGERIGALMRRFSPNVRVLVPGKRIHLDAERRPPFRSEVDADLARFGLRVDTADCMTITVYDLPPPLEIMIKTSVPVEPQSRDRTYLATCHVVPDDTDRSAQRSRPAHRRSRA